MHMRKAIMLLSLTFFVFSISATFAAPLQQSAEDMLEKLGGYACPDSDFTCVKLSVPLDHFAAEDGEMIDVVFGVLPASGERKGMFVVATGGPGTSGLAASDSYVPYYDPSIPEHFDMVFFDQRGSVQSGNLQCRDAVSVYYQTDQRTGTAEEEAAVIDTAKAFAEDCVKEMGVAPEKLAHYGTKQAVEDLEAFRRAIGDDKFWLYGESYGTQYAQTYAAAHPDHLAALILDGTVDLTLTIDEYYTEQAKAFDDVFTWLMNDCKWDEVCSTDTGGGDLLAFYDDLIAELTTGPISFEFPLSSGGTEVRALTLADVEYTVTNFLYSESQRMLLQRALTAGSQGNFIPLARLIYSALAIDPETLTSEPDPTYSDALFYTVECNDYDSFSGTQEERAQAYMDAGDAIEESVPRFDIVFYGDLPCVFWPGDPVVERPAPLTMPGVPTIVLGASADAYTPKDNSERVYSHLDDGYLIITDGGAHITYAWGNECPDEIITDFLVEGKIPEYDRTLCSGVIATDYVPNAPTEATSYADPLEALNAAYNEIYYLPEYYFWDAETPTAVGCTYGGRLSFETIDKGQEFDLVDCAFSKGFAMTGTGFSGDGVSDFSLEVAVSGDAEGKLVYVYDSGGNTSVTGEYKGKTVDLAE